MAVGNYQEGAAHCVALFLAGLVEKSEDYPDQRHAPLDAFAYQVVAAGKGFEPLRPLSLPASKAGAINRSANPPRKVSMVG